MQRFILVLALAGCSKQGSDKVASCHMESMQSCREYRGDNLALGVESLQQLCTIVVSAAKFGETACPTAGVIATCAKPEHKDYFYEGYAEAASAIEASCKQGGGTFAAK